jgi:uncharacterized damage-inducible protein DinB
MKRNVFPTEDEYALYYDQYVRMCNKDLPISQQLKEGLKQSFRFFSSMNDGQLLHRYAENKWSVKDVLQHVIDVERVFQYRAMCFARGEKRAIPFIDENEFAKNAKADAIPLKKILADYKATRQASLIFLKNQTLAGLKKTGYASNTPMSVRACFWVICGHEQHHINVIKERYL